MKQTKFRALKDDISNCNFVYGQLVYDANGCPRITEVDKSGQGLLFHTCLKNTESQFTGLKDNNGTDIYEGDIIGQKFFHNNPPSKRPKEQYKFVKLPVIFSYGAFHLDDSPIRSTQYGTTYGNWWQGCEVLGNIFENPDFPTPTP